MDMAGSLRDGKNGPFMCDGKDLSETGTMDRSFTLNSLSSWMSSPHSVGNERSLHVDGDFAAKEYYFLAYGH